ncbi:DUF5777 family beta-barrel protein [Paradesertivirga mongoliensis]|uniref:DUF5777 family beta-barrel protein n=1 Tax=Paradesertivirga mongoliensis TaxID=2100740 RepID=A0ABW4ZHA0_9SPHI|nr:DUF5777 family beta-barrel protein [Pedobacter mongoliensis]
MNKLFITVLGLIFLAPAVRAQDADSLLSSLDSSKYLGNQASATFKSTRIVLSHSTETQKKYDLDLRIRHHFGDVGGNFGGSHTLYGLDVATDLYIGFDYGLTDRLTLGIGRSKHNELFNFFAKQKAIGQSKGASPVTLTLLAQAGIITREEEFENEFNDDSTRTSYVFQALISRKFSERLSVQISPTYLLRSLHVGTGDNQNLFSLGFAGRFKLSKRLSLVGDYQLVNAFGRPEGLFDHYFNPLGVGLEIETGGHVFSLNFMNSEYIIENSFIPDTQKSWNNGGVRFGFTMSRNFSLRKSKNPDIQSKIY